MARSQFAGATVTFTLPFWIMEDQFGREPRGSETRDGNLIEDELSTIGATQVCLNHQVWCEFALDGAPHQLHDQIEQVHQKIETILRRYHQTRKKGA